MENQGSSKTRKTYIKTKKTRNLKDYRKLNITMLKTHTNE